MDDEVAPVDGAPHSGEIVEVAEDKLEGIARDVRGLAW
jgi:hypothetical protein